MKVRDHRVGGLLTRVTAPDAVPPRAHLVLRTPYDSRALLPEAEGWAALGLGCVLQDVRGRYGSPGRFSPFVGEGEDGARLVRWVREELGGPVVLYGPSYAAHCAMSAHAREPADALALLVPAHDLAETARTLDGAFELAHRIGWWSTHACGPRSRTPPPVDLPRLAALRPEEVGRHLDPPADDRAWRALVAARRDPAGRRAAWAAMAPVPLLVVAGTRDWFAADASDLAAAWAGPTRFVLGPWDHSLRGAARARRISAWLERVLVGDPPDDVELLDDSTHPVDGSVVAPARCAMPLGAWTPDAEVRLGRPPVRLRGLPAHLHGDLIVRLDAETEQPDADWVVDLVRTTPDGTEHLAHAAGPTPELRLGPVLARHRPGSSLDLLVAAGDVPRHPRPPDAGRARRLHGVRLERTHA